MKGLNLPSILYILVTLLLLSGIATGAGNTSPSVAEEAEVQAFHSVNNASIALYAGQNALQAGQYEEALEQYNITTTLDPSWLAAWYLKAYALEQLNRSEEALVAVDRALSLDPSDRDSNELKADILDHLGRSNEAAKYRKIAETPSTIPSAPVPVTTTKKAPVHPFIVFLGLIGATAIVWRWEKGTTESMDRPTRR